MHEHRQRPTSKSKNFKDIDALENNRGSNI